MFSQLIFYYIVFHIIPVKLGEKRGQP